MGIRRAIIWYLEADGTLFVLDIKTDCYLLSTSEEYKSYPSAAIANANLNS